MLNGNLESFKQLLRLDYFIFINQILNKYLQKLLIGSGASVNYSDTYNVLDMDDAHRKFGRLCLIECYGRRFKSTAGGSESLQPVSGGKH